MLLQVFASLPPASQRRFPVSFDTTAPGDFQRMSHVACRMSHATHGPVGRLRGLGEVPRGPATCAFCAGPARMHRACACAIPPLAWAVLAGHTPGSAISGHSARKPPRISAPHRHTLCACASGKNRGACVETGLCVPRPLRVPHVQKFWSACTDRSM